MVINKSLLKPTKDKPVGSLAKKLAQSAMPPKEEEVVAPSITANAVAEKVEQEEKGSHEVLDLAAARKAVLEEIKKPAITFKKNTRKKLKKVEEEAPIIFKTPLVNPDVLDQPLEKMSKTTTLAESPKVEEKPLAKKEEVMAIVEPAAEFSQEDSLKSKILKEAEVIGMSFLSFLIFCLVISTLGLYLGKWQGALANRLTAIIPYPAAMVNGQIIGLKTFLGDITVLDDYLIRQGQPQPNDELRQQVMASLVKTKVVEQLAKAKNLTLSEADFNAKVNLIFPDESAQTEAQNLVKSLYHWDWPTYLNKVLKPILLAEALEKDFSAGAETQQLKEQLANIRQLVAAEPTRFAEIAAEVNQDDSKNSGGDLGYLKLGETVPEFEFALLQLQAGEFSQMVETRYGYHLIKLEEKMNDDNEEPIFHASHIFLKRPDFNQYLNEQILKANVLTLIRI